MSECRSVGVSECRSVGVSECRSVGVSECWSVDVHMWCGIRQDKRRLSISENFQFEYLTRIKIEQHLFSVHIPNFIPMISK